MNEPEDRKIIERARAALGAAADQLDGDTRRRLAQARFAALDAPARTHYRRWSYAVGGVAAAAAVAVFGTWLWWAQPAATPIADTSLADLDLLTTPDHPEFFADLDFYEWLADPDHAG